MGGVCTVICIIEASNCIPEVFFSSGNWKSDCFNKHVSCSKIKAPSGKGGMCSYLYVSWMWWENFGLVNISHHCSFWVVIAIARERNLYLTVLLAICVALMSDALGVSWSRLLSCQVYCFFVSMNHVNFCVIMNNLF